MSSRFQIKDFKLPLRKVDRAKGNVDRQLRPHLAAHLQLPEESVVHYEIRQKSLDARKKGQLAFIYSLEVELAAGIKTPSGLFPAEVETQLDPARFVSARLPQMPIVVGTGPAGLLSAWLLALNGCRPVVIDRGYDVDRRGADFESFFRCRELNTESNFLYGEGGAGTYSDGKLYTRTRDPRIRQILELFIAAGAPAEIAYLKRPHIGSDILPVMVRNLRRKIEELGGSFLWGKEVVAPLIRNARCGGVRLRDGECLEAPAVFMGFGLSARELIANMVACGIAHDLKGFQLGARIEHPQKMIDANQFGLTERPECLGAAEYNFVSRPPAGSTIAGVSSFCMCPGGEIVPATAHENRLSTNGMSRYRRDGEFANSCLIVSFQPEEFGDAGAVFDFIDQLEKNAFEHGGGDYTAPGQDAAAFIRGENLLAHRQTSYRLGLTPSRLDQLLPDKVTRAFREALVQFDRQCPGFVRQGKLVGIETHVSSPVRFLRSPETLESSLPGLYVTGEGAGYAGGIVSAAVDGLKAAEKYLETR